MKESLRYSKNQLKLMLECNKMQKTVENTGDNTSASVKKLNCRPSTAFRSKWNNIG